jgi:hypothetical protein
VRLRLVAASWGEFVRRPFHASAPLPAILTPGLTNGESMIRKCFLLILFCAPLAHAQDNVTVDFSSDQGAVTHRASGFVNGMNSTVPLAGLVNPMKMKFYRGLAAYADEPNTYARILAQGAIPEYILSDAWEYNFISCYTPGGRHVCPGDGGNWAAWDNFVRSTVSGLYSSGQTALQYDIWNEPDITLFWPRNEAQYQTMWQHAVNDIRAINPSIQIVGPSTCCNGAGDGWGTWARNLLAFAKNNRVLPNIVSFHEVNTVNSTAQFIADVASAKSYLAANDPSITKIEVNEMISTADDYLPGMNIQFLAVAQRSQLWRAAKACAVAGDCDNLSLDGLLKSDGVTTRRAIWYAYQAYANVTGRIIKVTPTSNVDGIAGQDSTLHQAYSVFGRNNTSGTIKITYSNISSSASYLGSTVHVDGFLLANDNGGGSSGPSQVINANYPVSSNQIVVTFTGVHASDVVIVRLTRAS